MAGGGDVAREADQARLVDAGRVDAGNEDAADVAVAPGSASAPAGPAPRSAGLSGALGIGSLRGRER